MLKDRLEVLVGKNINQICDNRFHNPDENHCAHFVSHVLGIGSPFTCKQHKGGNRPGANIRVHEVFPLCGAVGKKSDMDRKRDQIVFITLAKNVDCDARTMANIPQKHVGIYCDGDVYHYGNTDDRVVKESLESFEDKFQKAYDGHQGLFFGHFPGDGTAIKVVASGVGVSAKNGFELRRDGERWHARKVAPGEEEFLVGKEVLNKSSGFFGVFVPSADDYGPTYRGKDYEDRFGHYAYLMEITGFCESRNRFNLTNTYDRAKFTFGFYQFAAHTPRDNLILFMRDLVRAGVAEDYFPELKIVDGRLHRVDKDGTRADLEVATATGPNNEEQLQSFMNYLNPRRNEVDEQEVLNAARLMHMANTVEKSRTMQVERAFNILEKKMSAYGERYRLDGESDVLCAIIADIHHQGRAKAARVKEALASGDPENALIDISANQKSRAGNLRTALKTLKDAGTIGHKRYQASSNTFL